MTAQNMGPTGPSAIQENTFTAVRHVIGRWLHAAVRPVVYKMCGYNTSTAQFEYWATSNTQAGPPSGATLVNSHVAAVIVDSFPTSE